MPFKKPLLVYYASEEAFQLRKSQKGTKEKIENSQKGTAFANGFPTPALQPPGRLIGGAASALAVSMKVSDVSVLHILTVKF